MTKFNNAQSSAILFWMGVPVNNKRFLDWNYFKVVHLCESMFLMAWASSKIMNCHFIFLKTLSSVTVSWYDVMTTWNGESDLSVNFFGEKNFLKVFLCLIFPQYGRTFNDGQNFLNYCCQLKSVLFGATIKKGPQIFFVWDAWANK